MTNSPSTDTDELRERVDEVVSLIYSQAWQREPKNIPFTETDVRLQSEHVMRLIEAECTKREQSWGDIVAKVATKEAEQRLLDDIEADLTKKYEDRKKRKGSRPQFSKQTETPGEYYSRGQGFLSGILIAKDIVHSKRTSSDKEEGKI